MGRRWDRIVISLFGKQVAILGPQAVGKTSLNQYLREGRTPGGEYKPTLGTKPVLSGRPRLSSDDGSARKIAIRKGADVPGDSANNIDDWARLIMESDMILYLFDAAEVLAGDAVTVQRLGGDAVFIGGTLLKRSQERPGLAPPTVVLGGSKLDRAPEWGQRGYGLPYFHTSLVNRRTIREARLAIGQRTIRRPPLVVGSLLEDPERFAFELIEQAVGW